MGNVRKNLQGTKAIAQGDRTQRDPEFNFPRLLAFIGSQGPMRMHVTGRTKKIEGIVILPSHEGFYLTAYNDRQFARLKEVINEWSGLSDKNSRRKAKKKNQESIFKVKPPRTLYMKHW